MLEQGLDRISAGTQGAGDTSTGPQAGVSRNVLGAVSLGWRLDMMVGDEVGQVSTLVQATVICLPDPGRSERVSLLPGFQPCSVFPAQYSQRS